MSQTVEQTTKSLERLFALQYFKDEEKAIYVQVIFENCAWIDAYQFDLVVQELCKKLKTNQHPKPAHFIEMYRQLAEDKGWQKRIHRDCSGCGGLNFVRVWVRDRKGHEFHAAKGCPECNTKYSNLHPDFTEIQTPENAPKTSKIQVKTIPPAMAQWLLNLADSSKLNVPQDLVDDLMEAAAQPTPADYRLRKYYPEKRKNELVRALITTPLNQGEEEGEASVDRQPVDVVDVGNSPPPAQVQPEYSEEDLRDVPF